MTTVNIEDLQSDLTHLIDQAAKGEPLTVIRAGIPVVTITAVTATAPAEPPFDTSKRFGFLRGQGTVPDDFNTMHAAEIAEMFTPKD